MARVRRLPSGTWQGRYRDYEGKQRYFTLSKTAGRRDTLRTAQDLETRDRKIALGTLPPPTHHATHLSQPITEIIERYLRWGAFQGGRKGRPWSQTHLHNRTYQLAWWRTELQLETLADCRNILPAVEEALQRLAAEQRAGKTLANYRESLSAFCDWCVTRKYLAADPMQGATPIDMTPQSRRRAMTADEIRQLLDACAPHRRLLYETAFLTGLRANELRHLEVEHLDLDRGGLRLHSAWTKNRQEAFQPLPRVLVRRLLEFAQSGEALRLYMQAYRRKNARPAYPDLPLLVVPQNTALAMYQDLAKAGIPRHTAEGKLDFHALRVAYITFIFEGGGTVPEAQALARHQHPELTLGIYARTRAQRLHALVEDVASTVLLETRAQDVHALALGEGSPHVFPRGLRQSGQVPHPQT